MVYGSFLTHRYLASHWNVCSVGYVGLWRLVLLGSRSPRSEHLQELDVERIDVREPDGTLRMTISSHAHMPGLIIGKQ